MLTSRHIEEDCSEVRQNREVCSKVQCLVIRTKLGGGSTRVRGVGSANAVAGQNGH